MLSGWMDGSAGAAAATDLTAVADEDDVTINVTSTTGFLAGGGVLMLGNEKVEYAGLTPVTFTGLIRGVEGTDAEAHPIGTHVYPEDAGLINYMFSFNVVEAGITGGSATVAATPFNFLARSLPRIVSWNFAFLQGDLIIVRDILMSMSLGFVIYIAYIAISSVFGILHR